MKKIGICTLYYNNGNYGANLQAYALRTIVCNMGYDAEMISYYYNTKIHKCLSWFKQLFAQNAFNKANFKLRLISTRTFNHSIPHSKLYYSNTILEANKAYDGFIVGSDQVWNPDWINKFLSLEFVTSGKLTVAYAASIGKINLNNNQIEKLKNALAKTKYISIREKESIPSLKMVTNKRIEHVLDPTMLLSKKEWDEICSKRLIKDKYVFCYFLGDNQNLRNVATQFANDKGIKIVTLPFLNGDYRKCDDEFGDFALYDVTPGDFLSLIKYADFVITDSFHGSVFAHIFETSFIVSGGEKSGMGCRMQSLTEMFGTEERYIGNNNMVSLEKIKYVAESPMKLNLRQYKIMKEKSLEFLREALKDNESYM